MEYLEETVPLPSRIFILEGRFSASWIKEFKKVKLPYAIKKYDDRLDEEWKNAINQYVKISVSDTQVYLLASYAYADLYVGKTFDVAYQYNDVGMAVRCKAVVLAIIHEWAGIPVPYVGSGHKSICMIDFPEGIPKPIIDLPEIDKYKSINLDNRVALCNEDTWNLLLEE